MSVRLSASDPVSVVSLVGGLDGGSGFGKARGGQRGIRRNAHPFPPTKQTGGPVNHRSHPSRNYVVALLATVIGLLTASPALAGAWQDSFGFGATLQGD